MTPRLGRQEADGSWRLTATPTALVIAMDPENKWATPENRANECRKLQAAIREEVVLQGGDIGQEELDVLVNIHVWGDQKYELANFTDDELLAALAELARGRDDTDPGDAGLAGTQEGCDETGAAPSEVYLNLVADYIAPAVSR